MTAHLRLVTEAPPERLLLVVYTRVHHAGTPRVVAECADLGPDISASRADARMLTRSEMESDPALAEALRAWDERDDTLLVQDFERIRQSARAASPPPPDLDEVGRERSRRMHPSFTAR
ncbi:MAG: hypothetical protein M3245_05580 [Actinomycetota bacterium]|nr:hypothetical protein [Actinomycetota bacterium]